MRGVICYYSATGNTRLACERVAGGLGFDVDLVDVMLKRDMDLTPYDVVGLAVPTDFGGMPKLFETFLAGLPEQEGKPAFVLNTYGFASGRVLRDLVEQADGRGFTVMGAHSLHTPENYPPMIRIGLGSPDQPKPNVVRDLDAFAARMARESVRMRSEAGAKPERPRLGAMSAISPRTPRTKARDDMGGKSVDSELCTECGICATGCPYDAIVLDPKPVFDMTRCYGCWRCYNRCPEHAIRTARFAGPYYAEPSVEMKARLRGRAR
jgi:ferredoxin